MKREKYDLEKEISELSDKEFRKLKKPTILDFLKNLPIALIVLGFIPLSLIASMSLSVIDLATLTVLNAFIILVFSTYSAAAKIYDKESHAFYSQIIAIALLFVVNYCFTPVKAANLGFAASFFVAIVLPLICFKAFLHALNQTEKYVNRKIEKNKKHKNLIFGSFFALCLSIIVSYILLTS